MKTGLYIHVPFCLRKCPYCDFYSVSSPDNEICEKYTKAVISNIRRYLADFDDLTFDTVYFGGGTPSLMPLSFFNRFFEGISSCIESDAEITMELNPKTADSSKLRSLRKTGINRLSVGVQSAIDSELRALGRIHGFREAEDIILKAHEVGFENISADLMIGIKGQTAETLVSSVDKISALPVKHISSYILKIEEGTEYYKNGIINEVPDEDEAADMYLLAVRELETRGFKQYEISNFSAEGYESRHNLKYWHCEEYIGIGPSAHSFFDGRRYEVPRSLRDFLEQPKQEENVNESHPGSFFEKAMLALRLTEGLCLDRYPAYAGKIIKKAEKYKKAGLIKTDNNTISLTPEGFLVSNMIISDILSKF